MNITLLKHKSKNKLKGNDFENWNQYVNEQRMLFKEYDNEPFYLTHKFDSRGRLYSNGHNINYQSDEYNKALFNLAKKEVCTG